jgi:hypothetical protein
MCVIIVLKFIIGQVLHFLFCFDPASATMGNGRLGIARESRYAHEGGNKSYWETNSQA